MSYTRFAYSDISVADKAVALTLANIGTVAGAEVSQLYVSAPKSGVFAPAKELKGFAKTYLQAGESQRVRIPFDDKAFRYFNETTDRYMVDGLLAVVNSKFFKGMGQVIGAYRRMRRAQKEGMT